MQILLECSDLGPSVVWLINIIAALLKYVIPATYLHSNYLCVSEGP